MIPMAIKPDILSQPTFGNPSIANEKQANKLCHDISGPLTSILINCELMLEENCSEEIRSKAETIFSEAMHINQYLREFRQD